MNARISIFFFAAFFTLTMNCFAQNIETVPPERLLSHENTAKIDEMQQHGLKLRKRICELDEDEARSLNDKMNECNRLNHVYQIEELLKQCRQLKDMSKALNYLEFERQECLYEECHLEIMASSEYKRIMQEWERLSPMERLNRDHQRFKCAIEALGITSS
ncbi:hypothetical protein HUG17_7132 [Dermatophagoides farinae]|uniref:Uncharacterized protein n=1 Tax=Dermatophagoides farinae TaxID=6954 RepID=A0A9D4NPC9_DERFA|nr:uncharacterized protein LOC124494954 [Dermatophagoides farinae]KAH7636926.1 hypothetical protein HUG17_7132 [Dermatophagoides farinae]